MSDPVREVDVLVVGGGPAGLAAATALKRGGIARVVVLERESDAGGVPRHCEHLGFGLRDLHRILSGPAYARRWRDMAVDAGVEIETRTMVTSWSNERRAEVTGPRGRRQVEARAVILATGARERPRSARLVPGTRPMGVFTTGQLQQWVHLRHLPVGSRALIVGAEHVSYSAVLTLRDARVRTVAMVTELPRTQTFRAFDAVTRGGLRVPVLTGTTVSAILGRDRVTGARLRAADGSEREIDVDTIVFTGDWIPDHELARAADLCIHPGTRGPLVDSVGRTTGEGVFAVGNLVHPVETADVAAQRAAAVGSSVVDWLRRDESNRAFGDSVPVVASDPLTWVSPNLVRLGESTVPTTLLRSLTFLERPRIRVEQDDRTLATYRLRRMVPNRSHHVPSDWRRVVDVQGGPVRLSVV